MADRDENMIITAEAPRFLTESTTHHMDHWVTNGKVIFPIRQGQSARIAELAFRYEGARNEKEALQQALGPLREVLKQLTQLADRLASSGR